MADPFAGVVAERDPFAAVADDPFAFEDPPRVVWHSKTVVGLYTELRFEIKYGAHLCFDLRAFSGAIQRAIFNNVPPGARPAAVTLYFTLYRHNRDLGGGVKDVTRQLPFTRTTSAVELYAMIRRIKAGVSALKEEVDLDMYEFAVAWWAPRADAKHRRV